MYYLYMDVVKHIVNKRVREDVIKDYSLFKYEIKEEKEIDDKIEIVFVRDNNIPHYQEIKTLEKQYFKVSKVPLYSIIVLSLIAFVYLTIGIIFSLNDLLHLSKEIYLYIFVIPSAVILLFVFLLEQIRSKQIVNYINNKEKLYKIYLDKMRGL